jgi:hypothetical protein
MRENMSTHNATTLGSSTPSAETKVGQTAESTSTSEVKNPWVLAGLLQMANDTIEDFGQLQVNVNQMTAQMNENTLVQTKAQKGLLDKKMKLSKKLSIATTVISAVGTIAGVATMGLSLAGVAGVLGASSYIAAGAAGVGKAAVGVVTATELAPLEKKIGEFEASSENTLTSLKDTTKKLQSMSETQGQFQSGYTSAAEKITGSLV